MRQAVLVGVLVVVAGFTSSAERAAASTSGGGTQRWASSYGYGGPAFSFAVGVSPDGSTVFASGTTVYGSNKPGDAATLAYDASTGTEKWVATYSSGSDADQEDEATRLAVSPDGATIFVTGASRCWGCSGSYFHGWFTVAYDASTGAQLWVARYAATGGAYSIAVSPDGSKVIVNGQTDSGNASAAVAYDASTGEQLWVIKSSESPVYWHALAVSPDSSTVYVAGAGPYYAEEYHVAAYDASDGTERWSAHYPGWIATALALSGDGSKVFVTGYDAGSCCGSAAATVAYDASTGAEVWTTQDERIGVIAGDTKVLLAVSPDGSRVFVAGYDCIDDLCRDQPFATVAYDASSGNRLWGSRYRSGGRNYPNDLAVSPDGSSVFLTGQETMPCYSPCTTSQVNAPLVAYAASSGNELWVASYENNLGWALAVSPDGSNVYLAGTFTSAAATSSATRGSGLSALSSATACSPSACGYSTAAYNTGPGPGTSQERDPSVTYDGWRNFFHKKALGGAYRASNIRGDTVRYRTPKTTSVVWLTHAGPDQGKAIVRIDGRARRTVDLYSPRVSARSVTFTGLSRTAHTIEVEVLRKKNAASTGTWVGVDGFMVRGNITVESSPRIRYGTWRGKSRLAASGASYRESGSAGATASFTFTGRSVTWVTAKGPRYGRARVVIDGVQHVVDLYRRTHSWRAKISYTGLSAGRHRIKIKPLGRKHASSTSTNVVFDAFVVRS